MTDLTDTVRAGGLLRPGWPLVVLLSGGRDSTCLLDVAARIAGAPAITALHVNYGLRDAAGEDERHCRQLCARLGVALEVRRAGSDGLAPAPVTGNVQAWARDARYEAAARLAGEDADIAAGHTATDQVETILYRLASSPSRRALLGMRPREGRLVRPLLPFTRAQTAAHCTQRGLRWREDESNASEAYARGRIRHGLVPALEAIHPAAQANVLALADILRAEAEVLDELVSEKLDGRAEIALDRLRELPPALRRLVIQRLADSAAGGPAAGVARRAEEVAAMPTHGTSALDLPSGVRATARNGVVTFERTPKGVRQQGRADGDETTGGEAPT